MFQFTFSTFVRLLLCSACVLVLMGPAYAEPIAKPPGTQVIRLEPPIQGRPNKRGERFYEIKYKDGTMGWAWESPKTAQNIQAVRLHINDYNSSSQSIPGVAIVLRSSDQVVSYIYPTFWTGQTWVIEAELKQAAPNLYKQLWAKVVLKHSTIVHSKNRLQARVSAIKKRAQMAHLKLDYQESTNTQERRALLKKIEHLNSELKLIPKALEHAKNNFSRIEPVSLVRSYRLEDVVLEFETRMAEVQRHIHALAAKQTAGTLSARESIDLERWQHELLAVQETLAQIKAKKQAMEAKSLRLDYELGSWHGYR